MPAVLVVVLLVFLVPAVFHYVTMGVMGENRADSGVNSFLNGTEWTGTDGSLIEFHEDGSYIWYKDEFDTSDYYYEGTFRFMMGQAAFDYITQDLSDYGVTEDELDAFIARGNSYTFDSLVCLVLHNTSQIVEGEEQVINAYDTPCFGFYFENEEYLDIANMNTGTYWGFTKK